MRRPYLSLVCTAVFWLVNHFSGSLNLISFWYVLFGFFMAGLVDHHDYDHKIPDWFTGVITLGAALGAWLLINYPVVFLLGLVSIQAYSAGGFREAIEDIFDFLLETDSGGAGSGSGIGTAPGSSSSSSVSNGARAAGRGGGGGGGGGSGRSIALVTKARLSPSRSLREETENLTRLCTIKAARAPAPEPDGAALSSAQVVVVPAPSPAPAPPAVAAAAASAVPSSSSAAPMAREVTESAAPVVVAVPAKAKINPAPAPLAVVAAAAAVPLSSSSAPVARVVAAAAAPLVVAVPAQEKMSMALVVQGSRREPEESEVTEDSDTDTAPPLPPPAAPPPRSRSHFPTLPLHSMKAARDVMNQYYDSDSTSDSDHGGRASSILTRRGARDLQLNRKFTRSSDRFGMSRLAAQASHHDDNNGASPPVPRSFSSGAQPHHQHSPHDSSEQQGMRHKPERSSSSRPPVKTPFPELPAAFHERFMQKSPSPSAGSSESRNKFMRADTVRSIAATPVSTYRRS